MKRFIVAALAALFAVAALAGSASAYPHAKQDRFIKQLRNQVAQLRSQMAFVNDCIAFEVAPITSYGDFENGTFGYGWWDDATGPDLFTSALDFTAGEDPVDAWVAVVNPACIEGATGLSATPRPSGTGWTFEKFERSMGIERSRG